MTPIGVHPAIGISTWSFYRRLFSADNPPPWPGIELLDGPMDLRDALTAIRSMGVRQVELNNHFIRSREPAYLDELRRTADGYGMRFVNIAIDDGDLSSPDDDVRREAIATTVAWMDAAVALGCPVIRQNSGGSDPDACTRSFIELAREAASRGLRIAIEAHGGFSSDADLILPIADAVRAEVPGALVLIPDFGNVVVTARRDRYQQIEAMAPYAGLCHPKMHDFDENGEQPEWDVRRLVSIVAGAGFRGPWIIEFEGRGDDFDGVRQSVAFLSRVLREVA